jgi:Ca-activated chloride channel homolog
VRRAALILLVLCAGGWEALRAPDPDVDKGNRAFKEGRYDEALGHYRAAEERGADPRLHFDMGAALYKLGEKQTDEAERAKLFAQAEEQFRRAADTEDAGLKSSAYFNLGNTMYQRQQWEDAISAYKRALRSDAKNEAARHNLEMALRQREKHDQQEQQQGQGQKGQGQKDQQQGKQGQQQQQDDPQQGQQDPQQGSEGQEQDRDKQQQGQQGGQAPPDAPDQKGGQERLPDRPPPPPPPQERKPDGPGQDQQAREQEDESGAESDSPTDQDRKLDELERRSRDLRKRLLRQGGKNRDPLRLPSRKDW